MKLATFTDATLYKQLVDRVLIEPIFDDNLRPMLPQLINKAAVYWLESTPGVVILTDIAPRRDCTCTIVLFEKCGTKYKEVLDECRTEIVNVFKMLQLKRMSTYTSKENRAARIMATHLGFHLEGVIRDGLCIHGVTHDHYEYGLYKEDVNNGFKSKIRDGSLRPADGPGAGCVEPVLRPECDAAAGGVSRATHDGLEPKPVCANAVPARQRSKSGRWYGRFSWWTANE